MMRVSCFPTVVSGPGAAEGAGSPVSDNETAEAPTVGEYGDAGSRTVVAPWGLLFSAYNDPGICKGLNQPILL